MSDLRYEFQLAMANRAVGQVETVFIMAGDQFALTSSSLIRQVVALGGDVRTLSSLFAGNCCSKASREAAYRRIANLKYARCAGELMGLGR